MSQKLEFTPEEYGKLNEKQQIIINGINAGNSLATIALTLGVPVGTVKSSLSRAKDALARMRGQPLRRPGRDGSRGGAPDRRFHRRVTPSEGV
jgi:hypothetical protein